MSEGPVVAPNAAAQPAAGAPRSAGAGSSAGEPAVTRAINPLTRGKPAAPAKPVPPVRSPYAPPSAPMARAPEPPRAPPPGGRGASAANKPPPVPAAPPQGAKAAAKPTSAPSAPKPSPLPLHPPPARPNPLTARPEPPPLVPLAPLYAAPTHNERLSDLLDEHDRSTPSLPIVLFSAAMGIAGAVVGGYLAWEILGWRAEWSVALAVLLLCAGVGLSGALLSAATGSRAALANITFSCGVILLTLVFFGLCAVVGGLAATILIAAS